MVFETPPCNWPDSAKLRERRLFTGLIPIPWYIFEDLNDGYRLLGTRLASRSAFPALVAQVETKLLRHAN